MAEYHPGITEPQAELIRTSPLFFVASVDPTLAAGPHGIGPVNVSPKGATRLLIVSPTRVAYLDYPGSGNETARHAAAGGPITVMVCSFDENAAIVRLYGRAKVTPFAESPLAPKLLEALGEPDARGRQVVEVEIELTMTSCGYGVPVMSIDHDRGASERGRRYKERPA